MSDDRLREAALGRVGLQLHHGLSLHAGLPAAPEAPSPPTLLEVPGGWLLRWPALQGRTGVAVRALDAAGQPVGVDGPFRDRFGRHLWCGELLGTPRLLPSLGLPPSVVTLDLRVMRLGRGPAQAIQAARVAVQPPPGQPWRDADWLAPLLVLAIAVVHADGLIRKAEVKGLRRLVQLAGGPSDLDLDSLLARPTPADLGPATAATLARLGGWGTRTLLEQLARLAVVTGPPTAAEIQILDEIRSAAGAPPDALHRLLDGWGAVPDRTLPDLAEAYATLGVPPTASSSQVKRAWRRAVQEHHPDRHADADEATREHATRTTARINAAYRVLAENAPTGVPAPSRTSMPDPVAEEALPEPEPQPQGRQRLTSLQLGMGFLALALLLIATGLAWNGHVEQALKLVAAAP